MATMTKRKQEDKENREKNTLNRNPYIEKKNQNRTMDSFQHHHDHS